MTYYIHRQPQPSYRATDLFYVDLTMMWFFHAVATVCKNYQRYFRRLTPYMSIIFIFFTINENYFVHDKTSSSKIVRGKRL